MKCNTYTDETCRSETKKLTDFFRENDEVAVAFSGGVDSSVLLLYAVRFAKRTKAYYVKSQFQPQFEFDDALKIAAMLGAETEVISVDILSKDTVVANPENRCYYCKREIFGSILEHAAKDGFRIILDGTNASDDIGDRPGFRALQELKVLSPLRMCGFTKPLIREIAAQYRLPVADKPSYACLATRIPAGTAITEELLAKTENAENALMKRGYRNLRIRYSDGAAKLELGKREMHLYRETKAATDRILLQYYDAVQPEIKERTDE